MASVEAPNVLPLAAAAVRYGMDYGELRVLVNAGVFTKHVFDATVKRPPMYVFVHEMEAYKRGGVEAVLEIRDEARRQHAPDLGGEG